MSEEQVVTRDHADACFYFPDIMAWEIKGYLPKHEWVGFMDSLKKVKSESFVLEVRKLLN